MSASPAIARTCKYLYKVLYPRLIKTVDLRNGHLNAFIDSFNSLAAETQQKPIQLKRLVLWSPLDVSSFQDQLLALSQALAALPGSTDVLDDLTLDI